MDARSWALSAIFTLMIFAVLGVVYYVYHKHLKQQQQPQNQTFVAFLYSPDAGSNVESLTWAAAEGFRSAVFTANAVGYGRLLTLSELKGVAQTVSQCNWGFLADSRQARVCSGTVSVQPRPTSSTEAGAWAVLNASSETIAREMISNVSLAASNVWTVHTPLDASAPPPPEVPPSST